MSRTSSVVDNRIIWRKCWSVTCVDAKFRLVTYLNTLHGIKRYKASLAHRSRSSCSRSSISLSLLIVDHHSKQVAAAQARSFRFRDWKRYIQLMDEVFISIWEKLSLKAKRVGFNRELSVSHLYDLSAIVFQRWLLLCCISFCENYNLYLWARSWISFCSFFGVSKIQSIFGFVIKEQKKDRFHKDACFFLDCERRRISCCCSSPSIITSFLSETSNSRKYVGVWRLVFCVPRVCEAHYFHVLHMFTFLKWNKSKRNWRELFTSSWTDAHSIHLKPYLSLEKEVVLAVKLKMAGETQSA